MLCFLETKFSKFFDKKNSLGSFWKKKCEKALAKFSRCGTQRVFLNRKIWKIHENLILGGISKWFFCIKNVQKASFLAYVNEETFSETEYFQRGNPVNFDQKSIKISFFSKGYPFDFWSKIVQNKLFFKGVPLWFWSKIVQNKLFFKGIPLWILVKNRSKQAFFKGVPLWISEIYIWFHIAGTFLPKRNAIL